MGALNSFAVWGSLAAAGVAVPIIIHLLYRKHRKQTDWAAMELLRRALVIRSGQVKLEDYLVLALRCLALLLLALALLRPVLSSDSAQWLGEKRTGMVVAIDASYSMSHGEHSRYERAIKGAREVLTTAREGDPVSLALMSNHPEVLLRGSGYVPSQAAAVLDRQEDPTPYRLSLERNIAQLEELVAELKTPAKECFLITDSQELDWASLSTKARDSLKQLTTKARVFVIPVGTDGEENLSLEDLSYTSGTLRQSGVARFTATVRNTGRRRSDGGSVEFFIDDELSKRSGVRALEPGEVHELSFFAPFSNPGDVRLKAQLSKDDLAADNTRYAVAKVRANVTVLCVEGGSPAEANATRSGGYYAVPALRLKDRGSDNPVQVQRIEAIDLALENLQDYDLVVLADVADLGAEMIERLQNFVRRGGGLMIFPGDRVDPKRYNERFGIGEDGLLPGELLETVRAEEGEPGWTIGEVKSQHPLAGVVSRLPAKALDTARIKRILRTNPAPGSETILTVAELDAPLLLSRQIGTGAVLLFTTSADRSWNELAVHPLYAMLMRQALTSLTSRPDDLQLTVGEATGLAVSGREVGDSVEYTNPAGATRKLRVTRAGDQPIAAVELETVGVYTIAAGDESPSVTVAANVDPAESNVKVVDASALEKELEPLGVTVLADEGDLAATVKDSRRGREISTVLLWLGVLVFLLQSILARYFTNKMDREQTPSIANTLQKSQVEAARRT